MDLAAVFAVSLLGGYYFASWWMVTAFSTRRVEGHHLYFRAALCGAIFFLITLCLRHGLAAYSTGFAHLDARFVQYVGPALKEESGVAAAAQRRRDEWLVIAAYSVPIALLCAALLNLITPRRWVQRRSLGTLDRLLLQAQQRDIPVQVTLNTGKVYIGLIRAITDPGREEDVLKLIPMFSGYRDAENRMVLTTDYEQVYQALHAGRAQELQLPDDWLSQFELAIRADAVVTATLFSPAVYAEFQPDWRRSFTAEGRKSMPQTLRIEIERAPRPIVVAPSDPPAKKEPGVG